MYLQEDDISRLLLHTELLMDVVDTVVKSRTMPPLVIPNSTLKHDITKTVK